MVILEIGYWQIYQYDGGGDFAIAYEDSDVETSDSLWPLLGIAKRLEEAALKDELRNPWFHYVRKAYQYGEFILLTPEMAEELLRHNPDNRNLKPWLTAAS